jgi:two-component system, NarL family, response regulator NreC
VKILLADDHTMMRDGLRAVLEKEGLLVIAEAATGREAVALALRLRPDVVVMDVSMPELNGIDATKRLVAELPGTKVIALSMHSDRRYVIAMFAAGAMGYLLKNSASEELIQAVRAVARNHKYVSPSVAGVVVDNAIGSAGHVAPSERTLSSREREVLQLIAEGHSSKEIARRLELAVPTIETHRRQIMAKLNIRTVAELTKYAIREGLTSIDH